MSNWNQGNNRNERGGKKPTGPGAGFDPVTQFSAPKSEIVVLSRIMEDPDLMGEIREMLEPDDFSKPAGVAIYEAMCELWEERIPATFPIMMDRLKDYNDDLIAINTEGQSILGFGPTFATYHASIVADFSERRRYYDTAMSGLGRLMQEPGTRVQDVLQSMPSEILRSGSDNNAEGLDSLAGRVYERLSKERSGEIQRKVISTGFMDIDNVLSGGFEPGELEVLAARPGMGKALALDTPIPTPSGWTTMGDLQVGDQVYDRHGKPCTVTYVTPVQHNRNCNRVVFNDGSEIIADDDHRWITSMRVQRKRGDHALGVRTTKEIRDTLHHEGRKNHAVPVAGRLEKAFADLPVKPYTFGVWLGDGKSTGGVVTNVDQEVWSRIEQDGYDLGIDESRNNWRAESRTVKGIKPLLRDAGVLGDKHIPDSYLNSGLEQRIELMQGLMDSDGHVDKNGMGEFTTINKRLAKDVWKLAISLGVRANIGIGIATIAGESFGEKYRVRFAVIEDMVSLSRKRANCKPRSVMGGYRYIESVEPIETVPVKCITVDSDDHSYLCGESLITTHNTGFAASLLLRATQFGRAILFSAEMSRDQIMTRMAATATGVGLAKIRTHTTSDDEHRLLGEAMAELQQVPMTIDDTARISTAQILQRVQRIQASGPVSLVAVDYLELIRSSSKGRGESPYEKISNTVIELKEAAQMAGVPILLLSQVGRSVEARPDKRPNLTDLRLTGVLEQTADRVLFLYSHDHYVARGMEEADEERAGKMEVSIAKNRSGATGRVNIGFDPETLQFYDLTGDVRIYDGANR